MSALLNHADSPAFVPTKDDAVKGSERVYRWLLRLYPRDFRDEYGQEMSLLFRARASDGSSGCGSKCSGIDIPRPARALEHDETGSPVRRSTASA